MGIIVAKFRKKQTTIEVLEDIDKEITRLQRYRRHNQELQKKFVAGLILYSILLYIVGALVFYFLYFPTTWEKRLLYSLPLFAFPILVWGIKKISHWHFVKRIASNDMSLSDLRERKKQILEDVMEKETYKKAREILEKFDPARFKQLEKPSSPTTSLQSTPGTSLRQRMTPPIRPGIVSPASTPHLPRSAHISPQRLPMATPMSPNGQYIPGYGRPPGPPLPRPVLPREMSKFDKFVEYIVGDGAQNRYALVCKYCHSHNGMALKEEFEYLAFRCCYCFGMNPARKMRPNAPKLEVLATPPKHDSHQDEDNEYTDDEEEESDGSENGSDLSNKKSSPVETSRPVEKSSLVEKSNTPKSDSGLDGGTEVKPALEEAEMKVTPDDVIPFADEASKEITELLGEITLKKQEMGVKAETSTIML